MLAVPSFLSWWPWVFCLHLVLFARLMISSFFPPIILRLRSLAPKARTFFFFFSAQITRELQERWKETDTTCKMLEWGMMF